MNTYKPMKRTTTPALHVRISDEAREMFDQIEREAHIRDSALTHAFVAALTNYWKRHRRISLPFEIADPEPVEVHETETNGTIKTKTTKKKP